MTINLARRLRSALLLLALAGCGQKGPDLYPVNGKVTATDGKPLENATVVFHPVGSAADAPKPRGKVGADGTFALTTHTAGDGAPPGEYRVTVELWLAGAKPDEPPVNRLPEKYAKPETSGLTATVTAGPNELKPLTVTVKR